MQRVVVTGGLGFIGSHVVDAMVAQGRDGHDRRFDGRRGHRWPRVRGGRRASCTASRSPTSWPAAAPSRAPTWSSTPRRTSARPASCVTRARSAPTSSARRSSWSRSASSTTSRSSRSARPRSTAAAACCRRATTSSSRSHYNVRLEYAIAKTLTEAVTINSRHRGLRGLVIRPFNVAGPRQSRAGGFVMPTFVQQALAGRPLTVFAGGEQQRAFLSAVDLARFVTEHLDAALESGAPIFNLGNPTNSTTVWGLAELIVQRLGSELADRARRRPPDPRPAVRGGRVVPEAAGARRGGRGRLAAAHRPRRADRRDRALLPRARRRARRRRRAARRGCSGLACRHPPSSSRRTRTTRRWGAPA